MPKKLFLWLIALLFYVLTAASPALSSPMVSFQPLDPYIVVGESFDVQVIVNRDLISPPDPSLGLTSFGFQPIPFMILFWAILPHQQLIPMLAIFYLKLIMHNPC